MSPNDVLGQMVAVFDDWQGFLKDPQYVRNGNEITWAGASIGILPEMLTTKDTAELSRQGQFSFRVTDDDSLIQIAYQFLDTGEPQTARLAYYEVGVPSSEDTIEVLPTSDPDESETLAKWVRFDYCHTGLGRVVHMDCHLHVSGLPGIRFAVTGIPTPKQFIEFVVSHFYPETYQIWRLTDAQQFEDFAAIDNINANSLSPQQGLADVYRRISHFRIPRRYATDF